MKRHGIFKDRENLLSRFLWAIKQAQQTLFELRRDLPGGAGGGLLGGRGTGTSDSNLVRVSRGEYIVPARAVRQPGVLAFLEALRRSGGSLRMCSTTWAGLRSVAWCPGNAGVCHWRPRRRRHEQRDDPVPWPA